MNHIQSKVDSNLLSDDEDMYMLKTFTDKNLKLTTNEGKIDAIINNIVKILPYINKIPNLKKPDKEKILSNFLNDTINEKVDALIEYVVKNDVKEEYLIDLIKVDTSLDLDKYILYIKETHNINKEI